MVSDLPTNAPEPSQDFEIPVGYFIPIIWCLCFIFLWRGQQQSFREIESRRNRSQGDEPLVCYAVRSDVP